MDSPCRSRIDGRELGAKGGRAPGRQVSHDCFPDGRIGGGSAWQAADEVAKVETRSSRNYGKPAAAADLGAGRIRETHEVANGVLLADIADIYESMRNATSKGRIGLGRPNVQPPISLHRIRADDLGLGQVVCLRLDLEPKAASRRAVFPEAVGPTRRTIGLIEKAVLNLLAEDLARRQGNHLAVAPLHLRGLEDREMIGAPRYSHCYLVNIAVVFY